MRHALACCLITLSACGTPAPPAGPAQRQPIAPRVAIDLSDPLSLVPANSDMVMKLDVAALRKSPLWAKYERQALELLAPSFVDCSYDPLAEVTTLTAGVPMGADEGMFVIRGLDRDKTLACLRSAKRETATAVTFDGEFVTLTNKTGSVNMFTFVDAHTMVVRGSKHPTKQQLIEGLKLGAPLRRDAAYLDVERRLPADAAFTMVFRPGSKAFAEGIEAKVGVPVRLFYATFHLTDRLELRGFLVLDKVADAAALQAQMQPQLEAGRSFFARSEARVDGSTVVLELAASEEQLKALVALGGRMLGGAPN